MAGRVANGVGDVGLTVRIRPASVTKLTIQTVNGINHELNGSEAELINVFAKITGGNNDWYVDVNNVSAIQIRHITALLLEE